MSLTLQEFADRLGEVMPVVIKEFSRRQTRELFKGKITLPQILIMEFLKKKGVSKMKDLAAFLGVSTAAVTGIVERLVRYAYAERQFDPADRRVIKIRLTARGQGLIRKIEEQRRRMVIDIFSKISEADRQDYLRILMQVRDVLQNRDKSTASI